ncbi:MAG: adenosylmethionine decarboxylase [Alphaproteobacteria bacterium]|nr:adenosylmethionine decarboxylase [Rhodospirillales bacterium]MCW9046354.1 adenosylmethionine decarboxylase [Alphaproteobacteria bacterium]
MADNAVLAEIGADLREITPKSVAESKKNKIYPVIDNDKDYFVEKDGVKFAGMHLLVDLWGAENLNDLEATEYALKKAATDAGATILHCHLHHFTPNGGISGVVVLAESHISIHTWPERQYAALDIFMCGECDPYQGIPALKDAFNPQKIDLDEQHRGIINES